MGLRAALAVGVVCMLVAGARADTTDGEPAKKNPDELRHTTEGTVSKPPPNHRRSKAVAITAGVLAVASGIAYVVDNQPIKAYQDEQARGNGAIDADGNQLGHERCDQAQSSAPDVAVQGATTEWRKACAARTRQYIWMPALAVSSFTLLVSVIYIVATPNRTEPRVAVRPVVAPDAVGASLTLRW
jgi:hypothetical protein